MAKYEELTQSVFLEMFGYLRSNEKNWKWLTIDDTADKVTDGEHATPQRIDTPGIKLLSARNIKNGYFDFNAGVDYIPQSEYLRISKRCNPLIGDVLISCSGSIGIVLTVNMKLFRIIEKISKEE